MNLAVRDAIDGVGHRLGVGDFRAARRRVDRGPNLADGDCGIMPRDASLSPIDDG